MQFNMIGVNVRGGIVYSRLVSSNGRYISSDNTSFESLGLKKNIFSIVYQLSLFTLLAEQVCLLILNTNLISLTSSQIQQPTKNIKLLVLVLGLV